MGSLPHLWQRALWYADVLQEQPKNIALAMGIAPDDVPALIRLSRKGLREAYAANSAEAIAAHDKTEHRR